MVLISGTGGGLPWRIMRLLCHARFHRTQKILQPFAGLLGKPVAEGHVGAAIEPEVAKILAHLAPCRERPFLAPEVEAERTHLALARLAFFVLVLHRQAPALDDRLAHQVEHLAGLAIEAKR